MIEQSHGNNNAAEVKAFIQRSGYYKANPNPIIGLYGCCCREGRIAHRVVS